MKKNNIKKQLKIWIKAYDDALDMIREKDKEINVLVFEPESVNAMQIRHERELSRGLGLEIGIPDTNNTIGIDPNVWNKVINDSHPSRTIIDTYISKIYKK